MPEFPGYEILHNKDGSITFQYTPTTRGIHRISVDYNGVALEGLPVSCVVQPEDSGYSTAYGSGASIDLDQVCKNLGFDIKAELPTQEAQQTAVTLSEEDTQITETSSDIANLKDAVLCAVQEGSDSELQSDVEQIREVADILRLEPKPGVSTSKKQTAFMPPAKELVSVAVGTEPEDFQEPELASQAGLYQGKLIQVTDMPMDTKVSLPGSTSATPDRSAESPRTRSTSATPDRSAESPRTRKARVRTADPDSDSDEDHEIADTFAIQEIDFSQTGGKKKSKKNKIKSTSKMKKKSAPPDIEPKTEPDLPKTPTTKAAVPVSLVTRSARKYSKFQCEEKGCHKIFTKAATLKAHSLIHAVKCGMDGCEDTFCTSKRLKQHQRSEHHSKDPISEDESGAQVKGEEASEEHSENESKDDLVQPKQEPDSEPQTSRKRKRRSPEPLLCNECGEQFLSKKRLQRHEAMHKEALISFECNHPDCDKSFKSLSLLTLHKVVHRPGVKSLCPHCPRVFSTEYRLKLHSIVHTKEKRFKCEKCGKAFKEQRSVDIHACKASEETKRKYSCDQCNKHFGFKSTLVKHLQMHNGTTPSYECISPQCERKFVTEVGRDVHMQRSHPELMDREGDLNCAVCGKSFLTVKKLEEHENVHSDERPYMCDLCGNYYKTKDTLRVHTKEVHKVGIKEIKHEEYECHICHKLFKRKAQYKYHMDIHGSTARIACNYEGCLKTFPTLPKLKEHIRSVHRNEDIAHLCPFEDCGKIFKTASSMKVHYDKHIGISNYACNVCNKVYTTKHNWVRHNILVHQAPEYKYVCPHDGCGKKYQMKPQLVKHLQVHATEKNFECTMCNERFKTYSTLYAHRRNAHANLQYLCTICGESFPKKNQLEVHVASHGEIQIIEQVEDVETAIKMEEGEIITEIDPASLTEIVDPEVMNQIDQQADDTVITYIITS